jgi:hypothetical protein
VVFPPTGTPGGVLSVNPIPVKNKSFLSVNTPPISIPCELGFDV